MADNWHSQQSQALQDPCCQHLDVLHSRLGEDGLPYFNPHRFRDALTTLGMQICRDAEDLKAWSRTLGHHTAFFMIFSWKPTPPLPSH